MQQIEAYLKDKVYGKALPLLIKQRGVDVAVYRKTRRSEFRAEVDNATSDVYSIYDTAAPTNTPPPPELYDEDPSTENVKFSVRMLIGHALYTPTDDVFAADFNDNYVITAEELLPGDRFEIKRSDGKLKMWKVVEVQVVGATMDVFRRYKVAAVTS